MKNNEIITSGAIVFKKAQNGKTYWFLVKETEEVGWEIPKIVARKGESSVRASIRMMAEKGSITAKILEEVGRSKSTVTINGKVVSKRFLFYLLLAKSGGEVVGFNESLWLEYPKAVKKLQSKKEKDLLKAAKSELQDWRKKREERRRKKKAAIL